MSEIRTIYDFNELLDSCYFHPEREYPSEMVKLRARMAMTLLWQASEITVQNFKFKQEDIRRILIDEMMPEDLDRAIEYADLLDWQIDFYRFALLILECLIYSDAKHVPFHALRHTFASNAFHYGMDIKMLATAIGHGSVETTMNTYAHATEEMQRAVAKKIDEAVGKVLGGDKARGEHPTASRTSTHQNGETAAETKFEAYKGKKRKPGKGYVKQLSVNCWQGRYTPTIDGKRVPMNIYAPTEKECEDKLAELIQEVQAERKAKKQSA